MDGPCQRAAGLILAQPLPLRAEQFLLDPINLVNQHAVGQFRRRGKVGRRFINDNQVLAHLAATCSTSHFSPKRLHKLARHAHFVLPLRELRMILQPAADGVAVLANRHQPNLFRSKLIQEVGRVGGGENLQVWGLLHDLTEDSQKRFLCQRMQTMFDIIH